MATIAQKSVTIQEVADIAKVSTKTVSRVINNEPGVHVETQARVLQVIKQLDYRPNLSARSLAGDRSFLAGLFIENPGDYVAELQTGAVARFRESGVHLMVEPFNLQDPDLGYKVRTVLGQLRLEGVILVPPLCDHPVILARLEEDGVPIVRIAPKDRGLHSPIIGMDDYAASRVMTAHLLEYGHRRIGFILGSPGHQATDERYSGFVDEMRYQGVPIDEELLLSADFTFDCAQERAERLLAHPMPPTAVFASNDDMAAAVMSVAQRRGLRLPDNLSVAGFDDTPLSRMIWPQMTTIRQPVSQMGAAAAAMILDHAPRRRGWPTPMPTRQFPFELVVRNSTVPLKP